MRLGRKNSSYTRPWTERRRFVLVILIGANLGAFVAQILVETYQPGFTREFLGLSQNGIQAAYAWQFLTAAILHLGPWHLLGNMIALYLLGRDVESILGQRDFLFLYLAGSVAGELGHLFLMPSATVLYAASGGVAAVMMAYATILPELELTSFNFILAFRLKAKYLAYGAIILGSMLVLIDRHGSIAHSAYLGGCAIGWLYAHLLGFGRPSFVQRALHQRKAKAERIRHLNAGEFISEEVDPVLEKISRKGIGSLTRQERRVLALAREKLEKKIIA